MTPDELVALVAEVRRQQSELQHVEVKAARGGTPLKPIREALSAFANQPGGGILLCGLDEERDFAVGGVGDVQRLQEEIANVAASEMEPPLRPEFTVAEVEGQRIVGVEVAEVSALEKPCHYRPAGLQGGAYIRVGPSNRRMTTYEIFGYVSAREQARFDSAPVPTATVDDLDRAKLEAYLARLRRNRPRASFLARPFELVLTQLGVIQTVDEVARPTLAGLLMFGSYPQAYEPQLVITFLHYFGTDDYELTPRGERFIDNQKFEGALDEIIEDAVLHVLSSLRKSSLIEGLYRRDIPEYPEAAIREAVINAVAHRDYSWFATGSYVQIRLFADRLEIQSPGGLYGSVTVETIEDNHSTRNKALVRFLEDFHVVENRGSGIPTMIRALREANLEPPLFEDRRTSFWVTFRNHTLMGPQTIAWLNQFATYPLNDHQRVALAYLRYNERIGNGEYRRLNHVDVVGATRDLRGLVQNGLVHQLGSGRWTLYTLAVERDLPLDEMPRPSQEDRVLTFVQEFGSIDNARCRALLGLDVEQARRLLTRMVRDGMLRREGERRWAVYFLP